MLHLKAGSDAKHVTKQINNTEKSGCLRMQWVTEKRNLFLGWLCEANIATLTSSEKNMST